MPGATPPGSMTNLSKTDSHAVLMELFACDQDLLRQTTKGAKQRRLAQNMGTTNDPHRQGQGMMGQIGTANTGSVSGSGSGGNNQNQLGSQHPMSKLATGGSSMNKLGLYVWISITIESTDETLNNIC